MRSRGFSLVELMMGIAILGILMFLGVPSFATFLQNSKLRNATESFYVGMQMARAEAVRRNAPVQIVLTTDNAEAAYAGTTNLTTTGPNWLIRVQDPTTLVYTFIEGKSMYQGSGQSQSATPAVQIAGTASSVTFNGFGGTTLGAAATFAFTNPTGGTCAESGGPMRCLNVVVSVGGQSRMCDPAVTAAGDTRRC